MPFFGIAINSTNSAETRNKITDTFSDADMPYWHWVDDFWIVECGQGVSARRLYEWLIEKTGLAKNTMLVIQIKTGFSFWGHADPAAWKWLESIGAAE